MTSSLANGSGGFIPRQGSARLCAVTFRRRRLGACQPVSHPRYTPCLWLTCTLEWMYSSAYILVPDYGKIQYETRGHPLSCFVTKGHGNGHERAFQLTERNEVAEMER